MRIKGLLFLHLTIVMFFSAVAALEKTVPASTNGFIDTQPDPQQIKVKKQEDIWAKYRQTRSEAEKLLNGRLVTIRLYDDWQNDPCAFELISVPLKGLELTFKSVKFVMPRIDGSTILAVTPQDQQDDAVAAVITNIVFAAPYKEKENFTLWPIYGGLTRQRLLKFCDGIGNPLAGAKIDVFLYDYPTKIKIFLGSFILDELGQWTAPAPYYSLRQYSFILSLSGYGVVAVKEIWPECDTVYVPFVRLGSEAYQRALRGTIVDPEGNPVVGASVECEEIRTLGGGLIRRPLYCQGEVISDSSGRFCIYVPNDESLQPPEGEAELVPPKSTYIFSIEAPAETGLLPYNGRITNDEYTVIRMEHGAYFHTFVFEDANGPIVDTEKLKQISVLIERKDKSQLNLEFSDWKDGAVLPVGGYDAVGLWQISEKEFEPIDVTPTSPQELIFRPRKGVLYYGQVIHGITSKPMQGVFVIAMTGSIANSGGLFQITPQQWQELHSLGEHPAIDDQALEPVRNLYRFIGVTRTDNQGRFQIDVAPGQEPYGFIFFEQEYLGVLYRKYALVVDKDQLAEIPPIKLFPAATVTVEPCVEQERITITPKWIIDENDNPAWTRELLAIHNKQVSEFEYNETLLPNRAQSFQIPAGLKLRIRLDTPTHDRRWCPITIDKIINLAQGQTLDLGEITLEPAVEIFVRVVDSTGTAVEGVPVAVYVEGEAWAVTINTDKNGLASFNVPPSSAGEFWVTYHDEKRWLKETKPYQINDKQDAGTEFNLQLSNEMLEFLFEQNRNLR